MGFSVEITKQQKRYNNMKHLGVILIVLSAITLIASYLTENSTNNGITFSAAGCFVLGLILHIILNKKFTE